MVSKRAIVIAFLFVVSILLITIIYFTFEISNQISPESIKVYWRGEYYNQTINPFIIIHGVTNLPNYTIADVLLRIDNPMNDSGIDFTIWCSSFTREINFLDYIDDNNFVGNFTRMYEYERTNPPDVTVKSLLMKNGSFSTWIQIWNSPISLNTITSHCNPFLKQTSWDKWEGKWFFDGSSEVIDINGSAFATANVSKLSFTVKIPKEYIVQNTEDLSLHEVSDGFVFKKSITSGDTFHLVAVNKNLASIKTWMDYILVGLGVVSLVTAGFLGWIWSQSQEWFKNRASKGKSLDSGSAKSSVKASL